MGRLNARLPQKMRASVPSDVYPLTAGFRTSARLQNAFVNLRIHAAFAIAGECCGRDSFIPPFVLQRSGLAKRVFSHHVRPELTAVMKSSAANVSFVPRNVIPPVIYFRQCGEGRQCGLRLQHLEVTVNVRNGPTSTPQANVETHMLRRIRRPRRAQICKMLQNS